MYKKSSLFEHTANQVPLGVIDFVILGGILALGVILAFFF